MQFRVYDFVCAASRMDSWKPSLVLLDLYRVRDSPLSYNIIRESDELCIKCGKIFFNSKQINVYYNLLNNTPDWSDFPPLQSVMFSNAKEVNMSPVHKLLTFTFDNCYSWADAALLILRTIGWEPDWALPELISATKAVPPPLESTVVYF